MARQITAWQRHALIAVKQQRVHAKMIYGTPIAWRVENESISGRCLTALYKRGLITLKDGSIQLTTNGKKVLEQNLSKI